jgi:hypothetical protein
MVLPGVAEYSLRKTLEDNSAGESAMLEDYFFPKPTYQESPDNENNL